MSAVAKEDGIRAVDSKVLPSFLRLRGVEQKDHDDYESISINTALGISETARTPGSRKKALFKW